jgi:hypothetical protein
MTTLNRSDIPAEIRRLFAELDQAYARVADAIPPERNCADANAAAKFSEAAIQASRIVKRIRELQGL